VARQRDHFYQRLLDTATGDRARRLKKLANESRQPFGHVRHELNMYLAKYGADQVQHRHLSWMFARMGFEEASCEEASVIPCLSARFESEIQSRLVMVPRTVRAGQLDTARRLITEVIEFLHRGIECGGLVDPWNILGFQGLFPLFFTREDSIPDSRVEVLLDIMGQIFDVCSLTMSEAAATGRKDLHDSVLKDFRELAEHWDRYATTTVNDLTQVEGMKSVEAATQVARVLAEWRTAGESAGDINFWRRHVEDFDATSSFAQVVTALLDRKDHVAAMGLLMQWLGQAETVPLENGPHSIHRMLHRLLQCICDQSEPENAGIICADCLRSSKRTRGCSGKFQVLENLPSSVNVAEKVAKKRPRTISISNICSMATNLKIRFWKRPGMTSPIEIPRTTATPPTPWMVRPLRGRLSLKSSTAKWNLA
jgi:hypothetical protein